MSTHNNMPMNTNGFIPNSNDQPEPIFVIEYEAHTYYLFHYTTFGEIAEWPLAMQDAAIDYLRRDRKPV